MNFELACEHHKGDTLHRPRTVAPNITGMLAAAKATPPFFLWNRTSARQRLTGPGSRATEPSRQEGGPSEPRGIQRDGAPRRTGKNSHYTGCRLHSRLKV